MKDGGPAFPFLELDSAGSAYHQNEGITIRDYFAAKAMQEWVGFHTPVDGAKRAYEWADAMLKAREQ